MADSQLILDLLFLHIRGGCSLAVLLASYVPSFTSARKFINNTTFFSGSLRSYHSKSCVVYEFSCRCEARHIGGTTQRLADRTKQHVPTSTRKKNNAAREKPPRICRNNKSNINCKSAIGQHLIANPECAKTCTDDNFRIIGQARSSFHLSVLECVYIKTQNSILCKQKESVF